MLRRMTPADAVPGVRALATYRIAWLRRDVVAGVVLSTLLVPQGMAYAELAGLPAITGLYTTILCLVGYAVFGPSRILVLGPDSSLGAMIAATLLPIIGANGSPERAVALASMLALIVGAIMLVAGIARLGFVADLHLEADADRLPERPRAHDPRRAAAQAVRVLGRRRRADRRGARVRRRPPGRETGRGRRRDRRGRPRR